jgi:hypothetical protein
MGLNIVLSLLDFSWTLLQLFHESQHPCYSLNIIIVTIFVAQLQGPKPITLKNSLYH